MEGEVQVVITYGYWCIDNLDIALLDKDLSSFDT
jgi:hypothetical protein